MSCDTIHKLLNTFVLYTKYHNTGLTKSPALRHCIQPVISNSL